MILRYQEDQDVAEMLSALDLSSLEVGDYTVICEIPPAFGPLHAEIVGDSFQMRDGRVLPPESPGLGVRLPLDLRERFAFVPGSGEFNPVPGKPLTDVGYPGLARDRRNDA